jgi:hypothetical protein
LHYYNYEKINISHGDKMCEVKFCRKDSTLIYYKHDVCDECFEKHCKGEIDLKKELKI